MNSITKETDLDSPTKKTWTWLSSRIISKHVNKKSIQNMIKARCTYVSFLRTMGQTSLFCHSWRRCAAHARRRRRRAVLLMQRRWMEAIEQSRRALPKNLIRPLLVRIAEDDGSGDLVSRSQLHTDDRDEVDSAAQQQRGRQNLDAFVGQFESCGARRIYREKPHRVRASRNGVSFCIEYETNPQQK